MRDFQGAQPNRFSAGDHLRVRRSSGYWHHGIHVGDGRVVEFGGDKLHKPDAIIREVSLAEFERDDEAVVVRYDRPPILARWLPEALPREERVERALFLCSHAAPGRYNLFGRNCEHVTTWCAAGFPESSQVRAGLYVNMLVGLGLAVTATWAVKRSHKPPVGLVLTLALLRASLVLQYHVHQGHFVREIDRAWRMRR
jgi:Lecithin retinol acyltransferase